MTRAHVSMYSRVSTHESARRRGCTTAIAMTFTRRQLCQFVGVRTDDIARNSGDVFPSRSEMTRVLFLSPRGGREKQRELLGISRSVSPW